MAGWVLWRGSYTAWAGSDAVHADGARAMRMLRCEAELAIQVRASAAADGDLGADGRGSRRPGCLYKDLRFAQGEELGDWARPLKPIGGGAC
ncbi:hypothetical protein Taro_038859 [Colocasia esculenta]|uniref:Uncharacterized protein n=1 Tax=Colocasia esculenta TaxID=4460 RepID=A0A843WKG8_COLES|nr:hypothetical protein [Colocasia esculenta]